MKLYYRISDKSYVKPKLIGATKEACLINFCNVFHEAVFGRHMFSSAGIPEDWVPHLDIIADRCERPTMKMIVESGLPFTATDKGNAGSFRAALEMSIESNEDDELVYFVEDDYLHTHNAPKLLEEGIKRSDYVTLYDHPDKYTRFYNMGEYSKVIKTESSHWRFTASTCMTFASKVKTLKEDIDIWKKYTEENHPWDHKIFTELGQKGRKLAVSIPGAACHTDLTFSGHINKVTIESWAIEMMIERVETAMHRARLERKELPDLLLEAGSKVVNNRWERLVALDAVCKHYKIES
jgi:hypothetical protein